MFLRNLGWLVFATASALADPAYDAAMVLVREHRYPEARDALEQVVAATPKNAAAWHELGLVWRGRHDNAAFESAVRCLGQAVTLEPANSRWQFDYGVTLLDLSGRTRSLSGAKKGREALETAVRIDAANLDAREALYQFYTEAPFFAGGSTAKAAAQLDEIRQRDPDRALVITVTAKLNAKDFAAAFTVCDNTLQQDPRNYTALYQYGRSASISGQRLERGDECLRQTLALTPPGPNSASHANAWYRIGVIQQKLGRAAEAKKAYESALQLDPNYGAASAALKKLP